MPSWGPKRVLKCPLKWQCAVCALFSFRPCPSKSLCTPPILYKSYWNVTKCLIKREKKNQGLYRTLGQKQWYKPNREFGVSLQQRASSKTSREFRVNIRHSQCDIILLNPMTHSKHQFLQSEGRKLSRGRSSSMVKSDKNIYYILLQISSISHHTHTQVNMSD